MRSQRVIGYYYFVGMDPDALEKVLLNHKDELAILGEEADRRLHDVARRLDAAASRGAMVVSAAAIASGVQVGQSPSPWLVGSVVASLVAAGLSLPLVRFKRGAEVNVSHLTKELAQWTPERLRLEVINVKMAFVKVAEKWMVVRSRLLLASLIALALAIALTILRVMYG